MANMGSQGIIKYVDDPMTTVIADATAAGVTWVTDAGGSATNFARTVAAGKGVHYIGVMDAADNSLLEFCGNNENFSPQEGNCSVEVLIQFSKPNTLSFNFGFNDTVEDGNLPIDLSGTTLTKTATEYCGLVFDGVDATDKVMHCVWVDDDTIAQSDSQGKINGKFIRMDGMAPTADKWFYMKVEMQDMGSDSGVRATFLAVDHLGRSVEKVFNTSVDRDATFTYHLAIETRAATASNIYLRGCNWEQTIPNM